MSILIPKILCRHWLSNWPMCTAGRAPTDGADTPQNIDLLQNTGKYLIFTPSRPHARINAHPRRRLRVHRCNSQRAEDHHPSHATCRSHGTGVDPRRQCLDAGSTGVRLQYPRTTVQGERACRRIQTQAGITRPQERTDRQRGKCDRRATRLGWRHNDRSLSPPRYRIPRRDGRDGEAGRNNHARPRNLGRLQRTRCGGSGRQGAQHGPHINTP